MADAVRATIDIGGRLDTVAEAERLIAALVEEDLVDDDAHAQSILREAMERKRHLWFEEDQSNYGTFNRIDDSVAKIAGLTCVTKYGAGDSFPEGWNLVTHVDGEAQTFPIPTNGGDPCIDYRDVKGIADLGDAPLARMVREKMALIKLAENIPPLTTSPAVATWLKIFGNNAA